jgi:NAD(P)-dependent dehydrogenase (short-subunit alcohol dehydrogenase family)
MSERPTTSTPVALVTGGAQGLGRASAEALAARGHHVVLCDVNLDLATKVAREFGPGCATAVRCDVGDTASVNEAVAQVGRDLGRLDVLVNNAGIMEPSRSEELSDESWERVLRINIGGIMRMSRASHPLLRRSANASITNISSITAHRGFPGRLAYVASKSATEGMTRVLATEWGPGIRVNAVAPGFILTERSRAIYESGVADGEARAGMTVMGRLGEPREIGEVVAFLASREASYLTGQVIVVDGGFLANGRTGRDITERRE